MTRILTATLLVILSTVPAAAVTTLHSFTGTDGREPYAGLILGSDGNFYGTTSRGGTGVTNPAGTVFKMTPAGDVTTLYTFDFQLTGDTPFAGVIQDGAGKLYGTTRGTGAYLGNVFRVGSGFQDLHGFSGYFFGQDGSHSEAGLVLGDDGKLYGTTSDGGANNIGTVFRVGTDGMGYTILHSFSGLGGALTDYAPRSALTKGGDGNFYGTTSGNGTTKGTVFRITPMGDVTTIHRFDGSDGTFPSGDLFLASDGRLYGTTANGGAHGNGTVFRIATDGTFKSLYSFDSSAGDGYSPAAGVIEASNGNFYGTTQYGGTGSVGTVYVVTPDGAYGTVASFGVGTGDGYSPRGALVQGNDGHLYGTTVSGGSSAACPSCGTVFKVLPGLPPTTTTSTTSTTSTSTSSTTSTSATAPTTSSSTTTSAVPTTVVVVTSTAVPISFPTTTLAAGGCDGTPDGATFASVRCRIQALRDDVVAESGLGAFGPKLQKNLDKALERLEDARMLCVVSNTKKTRTRLAQSKKALAGYVHKLKGLAARKRLDSTLRTTFLTAGNAIVPDLTTLRAQLACPADAAS